MKRWAGHRLMLKLPPSGSEPMAVSLCLRRCLTTPCAWSCAADIILASGTIHRLIKPGAFSRSQRLPTPNLIQFDNAAFAFHGWGGVMRSIPRFRLPSCRTPGIVTTAATVTEGVLASPRAERHHCRPAVASFCGSGSYYPPNTRQSHSRCLNTRIATGT